ncbi:MAG: murein L,D-transpeptidase catalytic domain family protein [Coxiellaceae bacterium]|nr:murein L,D-transpeptidase catalytic domain family protein [Coxiellaceae bacterium]
MTSNLPVAAVVTVLAISILASESAFAAPSVKNLMSRVPVIQKIEQDNPQLSPQVLFAGLRAYDHLRTEGLDNRHLLTIVDFNRPSNKRRLWILNVKNGDTQYFTYVAQGQNTGINVAKHFSNQFGSHESSIGVYLTGKIYYGVDGQSMRIYGLDDGFNSNVYQRDVVMHPAWYVSHSFAQKYNRIGNTYGCFGLNKKLAPKIISEIEDGTVMVAYYPNKKWLATSAYEQLMLT